MIHFAATWVPRVISHAGIATLRCKMLHCKLHLVLLLLLLLLLLLHLLLYIYYYHV